MCYHFWQKVAPSPSWQDISWSNFFCFFISHKAVGSKTKVFHQQHLSQTLQYTLCQDVLCICAVNDTTDTVLIMESGKYWPCLRVLLELRFLCFFWNLKGSTLNKRYTMLMYFQIYPQQKLISNIIFLSVKVLLLFYTFFSVMLVYATHIRKCFCSFIPSSVWWWFMLHTSNHGHPYRFSSIQPYSIQLSCVSLTFYCFLVAINLSAQFDINP